MLQGSAGHPFLDAAEACFLRFGVARTTIEDIAAEAGVSRVTVYRHLGTRDDIVTAVLVRTADRMLERLRPRLLASPDLGTAIVELVLGSMRAARADDLALLYGSDEGRRLGQPTPGLAPVLFGRYGDVVAELDAAFPGQLAPDVSAAEAGEWVLRIAISFLTIETDRPPSETRLMLERLALPALVQPAALPA